MTVKWLLYWQPTAGFQVTSHTLTELLKSIEAMIGTRTGKWQATAVQHRPFQSQREQAMPMPFDSARELLGVGFSDLSSKHFYVLRTEHMVVEADSSIQAIMEKLQVYKNRLSMLFEGFQYQLGDFQLKAGRAVLSHSDNIRGIVLEVEYFPVSSLDKTRLLMQEFVEHLQDAISASPSQYLSGRLAVVEPSFSEYGLADSYTWQHTALQYIVLFTHFISQAQR